MDELQRLTNELQGEADEIIRERKRKQFPKKYAPILESDMLVTLSECAFNVHKQDVANLVLVPNEDINFKNCINAVSKISYIAAVYKAVSIHGWDWRPTKWKNNRLYLTAIAPTLLK